MNTRLIKNATDFPLIEQWWRARGVYDFAASWLPPVGVIAEDENGPVAAVWLYMALGVGVAWMAHQCTNPAVSPIKGARGLSQCVGALQAIALAGDYHVVMTITASRGMDSFWKREGFATNHAGVSQLIKLL